MSIKEIPERIAYLILMFMHRKLSPAEHNELDEWVCESDNNLEMFEDATDVDNINLWYNLSDSL